MRSLCGGPGAAMAQGLAQQLRVAERVAEAVSHRLVLLPKARRTVSNLATKSML